MPLDLTPSDPAPHGAVHSYALTVRWTGNRGNGTSSYRTYERSHVIESGNKAAIAGSSDPAFRGDPSRWNPEELLLASISACHKLWYLSLCANAGVVVTAYEDAAVGEMVEVPDTGGHFVRASLQPVVTLAPESDIELAQQLHQEAHRKCFIANSVNFPVTCRPTFVGAVSVSDQK